MIIIPMIDSADQELGTIINNQRVTFRFRYNTTSDRWSVDVAIDDEYILYGRRLVTGVDILEPFDLGIGVMFVTGHSEFDEPNRDNIANNFVNIYCFNREEMDGLTDASVSS